MLKKIEFYNEVTNGSGFNVGSPASYLHGNVGDTVKVVSSIETQLRTVSDSNNEFTVSANEISRDSGSFLDDGFFPGQTIELKELNGGGQRQIGNIDFVDDTLIQYTIQSGTFKVGVYPDSPNGELQITTIDDLSGFVFRHNVIENNESTNYESKYNGRINEWKAVGMTPATTVTATAKNGANKDGSVLVEYVSNNDGVHTINIYHTFKIPPFYLDDFASNLANGTVPSLLITQNSLKYVFECELRFDANNPNNLLTDSFDRYKGSVGWYGEELNSNEPDFSVSSITYADIWGKTLDGIKPDTASIVTINLDGDFNSTTSIVAKIATAKSSSVYESSNDTHDDTFLFDSVALVGATIKTGSNIIKRAEVSFPTSTTAVVTVRVEYSESLRNKIDFDNDNVLLFLSIADQALPISVSNKCTLLAVYDKYAFTTDITGLLTWNDTKVFAHNDTDNGKTSYRGWPKDGLRIEWEAQINNSALLTGLKYGVVAKSDTDMFTVNEYVADLGNPPVDSNNVQFFNIATTRSFNLASDDPFNEVSLETTDNSPFTVSGVGSIKIGWQDWLKNEDVPTSFADITKPNNNLNKLASNYEADGYKLYVAIRAELTKNGIPTEYVRLVELDANAYGQDSNPSPEWTVATKIYDADENETGVIDTKGFNYITADFTPIGGNTGPYANPVIVIRLEKENQPGEAIYELSSLRDTFPNNPLVGVTGLDNVETTTVTGKYTGKCRIDGRKLESGSNYIVSARLFVEYDGALFPVFTLDTVVYAGSGSFDIPITALDSEGDPLTDGKSVKIQVEYDSTVAETLTGLTGQDISTFTTDHPIPNNSIINFISGEVANGVDLSFDKLDWATQNDLLNANAVVVTLRSKAYDRGFASVEDTENVPIRTISGKGFPKDIDYISSTQVVFADYTKGVRSLNDDSYTELIGEVTNATHVGVDRTATDKRIYVGNGGTTLYEFDNSNRADLGGSGTGKVAFINAVAIKALHVNNGKTNGGYADIWVGGLNSLLLKYRNGSIWSTVDFATKISGISSTMTIVSVAMAGNNNAYVFANEASTGGRIFKLEKTGGGNYYDVTQWTATSIISAAGVGTADGVSGTARFSGDCRKMVLIGYDDVIAATSGTYPDFLISDYGNDIYRRVKRTSAWEIITEQPYCGTTSTNIYDFPSAGNDIEVGKVTGMTMIGSNLYGTGEGTPDRIIFKLVPLNNALQQGYSLFEGTTGYQEQVSF